jgi:predicted Zn-dependent protease
VTDDESWAEQLHEELHRELVTEFALETEAWATERVERVMARLNAARPDGRPLQAHVLWIRECTAFTTPAPHVYISRRLLEKLPSDECVAFVLGHETAHHDLQHLDVFRRGLSFLPKNIVGGVAAKVFHAFEHGLYGPEREADADAYAVEICRDAGYAVPLCLQAFEVLENESLDRGDYDGVFGPENLLDPTDPEQGSTTYALQRWLWTRSRRYLPLRERRERAWAWYRRREAERGATPA